MAWAHLCRSLWMDPIHTTQLRVSCKCALSTLLISSSFSFQSFLPLSSSICMLRAAPLLGAWLQRLCEQGRALPVDVGATPSSEHPHSEPEPAHGSKEPCSAELELCYASDAAESLTTYFGGKGYFLCWLFPQDKGRQGHEAL